MWAVVRVCDPVLRRLLVRRQLSLWWWWLLQTLRTLIQDRGRMMSLGRRSESSAYGRLLTWRFLVWPQWFSSRTGGSRRHLVHGWPLHIPLVIRMTDLLLRYLWLLDFRQTMSAPIVATTAHG